MKIADEIIAKYKVRLTLKPGKDVPRKKLCGIKKNPDGRSFDIPAHQADYYKTLFGADYILSDPFLPEKEDEEEEEELERIIPIIQHSGEEKKETTKNFNEEIKLNPGEFQCWCGFKTDNYRKFDRHAFEHEQEKKKAAKEAKKNQQQQEPKPSNESGFTFVERIQGETIVDEIPDIRPAGINAQSGVNE